MAKTEERFVKAYTQGRGFPDLTEIWVDKETGVNYLFHAAASACGQASGLTPLLKADGTPVVTPVSRYSEK